jgi:hypothetical protein
MDPMITEQRLEKALAFLSETDESHAVNILIDYLNVKRHYT